MEIDTQRGGGRQKKGEEGRLTHRENLVWLYGISTIVGYSKPNPVFIYVKYIYDL